MKKFSEWLNNNVYNLMLWIIGILNTLPLIAPIFAYLKVNFLAKAIYSLYSAFCHQLHWRSLHVCDHQYGWCSRCTFIWLNVLLTGILVKVFKVKRIKWYWYAVFFIPMALDGIIQTIATLFGLSTISNIYYMSNNFIRMFTGALFGMGFGLLIWTTLQDSQVDAEKYLEKPVSVKTISDKSVVQNSAIQKKERKSISIVKLTIILLFLSIALYFLMVVIWAQTSPNYQPVNLLDFGVKTPPLAEDFLIRQVHGVY